VKPSPPIGTGACPKAQRPAHHDFRPWSGWSSVERVRVAPSERSGVRDRLLDHAVVVDGLTPPAVEQTVERRHREVAGVAAVEVARRAESARARASSVKSTGSRRSAAIEPSHAARLSARAVLARLPKTLDRGAACASRANRLRSSICMRANAARVERTFPPSSSSSECERAR
jgi:hypothetical protein